MRKTGISISVLRDQWIEQVNKQTKPAPREHPLCPYITLLAEQVTGQSKLAGKREVEALLILEQNLKNSRQHVRRLETQVIKDTARGSDVVEMALELQELREGCISMAEAVRQKRAALGVGQRTALRRIQDDAFLQLRVNARTLKTRIRDHLCQRKFELEPLERSSRRVKGDKVSFCLCSATH